jgi:hypothetical protein
LPYSSSSTKEAVKGLVEPLTDKSTDFPEQINKEAVYFAVSFF